MQEIQSGGTWDYKIIRNTNTYLEFTKNSEKIHKIAIFIIENTNRRAGIIISTHDKETYLKILQNQGLNEEEKKNYYFDNSIYSFSKVKNRSLKEWVNKFWISLEECGLVHTDRHETTEECIANVKHCLSLLKNIDSTVEKVIAKFSEEMQSNSN